MVEFLKTLKFSRLTRKQTIWLVIFCVFAWLLYGLGSEYIKRQFAKRADDQTTIRNPENSQSTGVSVQGNSNTVISNSTVTTK